MDEAARKARNAYQAEWRRRNPDKVKATMDRYWEKKSGGEKRPADYEGSEKR